MGILNQDSDTYLYMMGSKVLAWAGIYTVTSDVRTYRASSYGPLTGANTRNDQFICFGRK